MSFVKVYIHFVWNTKNRHPFLSTKEIRRKIWQHIRENAKAKEIYIDRINGYKEHCHCLISLGKNQTIQEIAKLLKGESSHWINKENILENERLKFSWQEEYYAVSVSESILNRVRNYIENQERHHLKKTYQEECEELIEKFGFERLEG